MIYFLPNLIVNQSEDHRFQQFTHYFAKRCGVSGDIPRALLQESGFVSSSRFLSRHMMYRQCLGSVLLYMLARDLHHCECGFCTFAMQRNILSSKVRKWIPALSTETRCNDRIAEVESQFRRYNQTNFLCQKY